jgi:hypothetical protein
MAEFDWYKVERTPYRCYQSQRNISGRGPKDLAEQAGDNKGRMRYTSASTEIQSRSEHTLWSKNTDLANSRQVQHRIDQVNPNFCTTL